MTQWAPMDPFEGAPDDDGIPAADPGAGAPPTAEGFGVGGEEPDRPEESPVDVAEGHANGGETPFRTPDPDEVGTD